MKDQQLDLFSSVRYKLYIRFHQYKNWKIIKLKSRWIKLKNIKILMNGLVECTVPKHMGELYEPIISRHHIIVALLIYVVALATVKLDR